jgi:hypothetical protein
MPKPFIRFTIVESKGDPNEGNWQYKEELPQELGIALINGNNFIVIPFVVHFQGIYIPTQLCHSGPKIGKHGVESPSIFVKRTQQYITNMGHPVHHFPNSMKNI